jgi:hypothetical protein
MSNVSWFLPILMLASGVLLMLWTTRFNRNILNGQETSASKYFIGSGLYGLWVFLISVGGILTVGLVYEGHGWSSYETVEIVILGAIGGILAAIGSLWQFFIVTKFREILYQSLNRKNKQK